MRPTGSSPDARRSGPATSALWGRRLLFAFALAACGGGGGGGGGGDGDAGPDPEAPDAAPEQVCEVPAGPTYLLTSLGIAPASEGFDLDGDDTIDNVFGELPFLLRLAVNSGYQDSLDAGEWVVGTLQDEWTDPPADDDDTGFHILTLIDADEPDDVSNDRTGGAFYVSSLFLDLDCQSTSRTPGAIEDRTFTGSRDRLDFPLNTGTGSIEMVDMTVRLTYSEDHTTAGGMVGSFLTMCSLSAVPLPLPDNEGGSVLDYLANNQDVGDLIDGDLDGDGLELVVGDGNGIMHCVDGDGTIIEGADCPCYPEIADAFSSTLAFEVLQVPVLGLE